MEIQVYRFTGISPLLMANINSVNLKLPKLKLGTKPNSGDVNKIAEGNLYKNDDGSYYMPCEALRLSLFKGCSGQKFAGDRRGPATIFQGLLFPAEDRANLIHADGKPIKKHVPQIDSGVNKATKARIIVVRPRIEEWQMDVPFQIDDEFAPENYEEFKAALLALWNRAGRAVGIGAWRPENKGRYGRYSVEQV